MTKRTRLLLAGAAVALFALIPGSAGAATIGSGDQPGHRCHFASTEAPASTSY